MIDDNANISHRHEFISYRDTIGKVLVSNYGNSTEAQQYLLKYGASNSSLQNSSSTKSNSNQLASWQTNQPIIVKNSVAIGHAKNAAQGVFSESSGRRYILVASGDTAYSLSNKYAISRKSLETINNLSVNRLKVGMKLYLDPK